MKPLLEAELYEKGLQFWPYKASLKRVLDDVATFTPKNGRVLDIMCGTGYLLSQIKRCRTNLELVGVDIDDRYVEYGRKAYPSVSFEQGDVLTWQAEPFDVVMCTGALHHVPYAEQEKAIANIASLVKPCGCAIIADCYVEGYTDEVSRKLAAARLGYEYLQETIRNGAPGDVLGWTVDILSNDVLGHECKTSVARRVSVLKKHFKKVDNLRMWPIDIEPTWYGDFIHFCDV